MTIIDKKNRLAVLMVGFALCFSLANPYKGLAQSPTNPVPPSNPLALVSMGVYQEFAKYPPESRPLNTSNWDLLHPWSADSPPLPMLPQKLLKQMDSLRASGLAEEDIWNSVSIPSSLPKYQFELNKAVLTGTQDELQARLTALPDEATGAPVRIHITKAELIGDGNLGSSLGPVPFSCETTAVACTFKWKAPAAEKQYSGALELVVTAKVEGMADEFVLRQAFYSSPIVAGNFTGQFQERLESGSLVIDAGVQVQKRMACFVSANLFSVDKAVPTHHVERRMIVDPSMKVISFTFFGKIFRDFGYEGTFRAQDLRAQCENVQYPPEWFLDSQAHDADLQAFKAPASSEPAQIYFGYNSYTYTTHKYASAVFSDQEWQSTEKTRKLQMYKNAAVELNNPAMEIRKRQLQQQPK